MVLRFAKQIGPVVFAVCLIVFGIILMLPSMRPSLYLTFAPPVSESGSSQSNNLVHREEQMTSKQIGRLQIPSIKLSEEVVKGISKQELAQSIGFYPQGSWPGTGGNVVLFGHNHYDRGPLFWLLRLAQTGDDITLSFDSRVYRYRISTRKIVSPKKLDSYFWDSGDRLTLVTCYPPGTSEKRLLVIAQPID